MKKTLLALLLVLCMLVTFTAFTASAEETEAVPEEIAETATHTHCVCGGSAVGVHDHQCADIVWTPLSEALTAVGLTMQTADFGKLPSGNYYLDGDVIVTAQTSGAAGTAEQPGHQLAVCLNGHDITASGVKVFGVRLAYTDLNICDCSGTQDAEGNWSWDGTVTAAVTDYGVANVAAGAIANVYGGNLIGQSGMNYGSCFNVCNDYYTYYPGYNTTLADPEYDEYGTTLTVYNGYMKGGLTNKTGSVINSWHYIDVNIYGGTIEGGGANVAGGTINVGEGRLVVENATIIGAEAPRGGAIVILNGSITNATIIGGKSIDKASFTNTTDYNCGGAMAVFGKVTIENSTISDGQAQIGGNIYVAAQATLTIKGNTVIEDGKALGTAAAVHGRGEDYKVYGQGGNIFVANKNSTTRGKVYMYDGVIRDGTADYTLSKTGTGGNGGNVSVFGEFYLYGGKVYGGTALANPAYQYNATNKSWTGNQLKIEGGYIYDGQAYGNNGGNIFATRGTVTLVEGMIWGGKANADNSVADTSATSGTNYSPMGANTSVTGGSIYIAGFASSSKTFGARFVMTGGSIGINDKGEAAGGTVTSGGLGGNIYITRGTDVATNEKIYLQITGGTIANGTAPSGYGGNIYANGAEYVTIGGTAVIRNGSAKYGGNIYGRRYSSSTYGTINIQGGKITEGTATTQGGNLWNSGTVEITGGEITKGTAETGSGGNIYNSKSLTVKDATLSNGICVKGGGGNVFSTGGTVTIENTTISNGNTAIAGGGIRMDGSASVLNLTNVTLTDNVAGSYGGSLYTAGTVTATDCTFSGGQCVNNGGNIYATNTSNVTLTNCIVENGIADNETEIFTHGGNIATEGVMNISGGTYSGGQAQSGGNLSVNTGTGALTVENATIENGYATLMTDGTANGNGGNLEVRGNSTATVTGCTFNGGEARRGGSIAVFANASIVDCTINGGKAVGGGGGSLFVYENGILSLSGNTTVYGGEVTETGAALHMNGFAQKGVTTISDGVKIYDGANGIGKGVYVSGGDLALVGNVLVESLYVNNTSALPWSVDVSELTVTTPIATNVSEASQFGVSETDKSAMFVSDRYGVIWKEGKLYLAEYIATVANTKYVSLQTAIDAAANGYVKLLMDCADSATVSSDLYLDLNGHSITGTVTVNEGATLYGMDSTTDDYDCTEGYGTIAKVDGQVAHNFKTSVTGSVRRYVTHTTTEGVVSFHRFYVGITSMTLRPGVTGVGYKATFAGDAVVKSMVEEYGYNLWVDGYEEHAFKGTLTAEQFAAAKNVVALLLKNFDVANFSQTPVHATAYIKLNGQTVTTASYYYTLKELVEHIAADVSGYNVAQMEPLQKMCKAYETVMEGWTNIANILNWKAPEA